ncbi:MAG: hypothetical protein ABW168_16605, partial [Sedimenticola sp.]
TDISPEEGSKSHHIYKVARVSTPDPKKAKGESKRTPIIFAGSRKTRVAIIFFCGASDGCPGLSSDGCPGLSAFH